MTGEHIDDLAELYALGTLDVADRLRVDQHARTCEACAIRLGDAEEAVAALIEPREPSPQLDRRIRSRFASETPRRSIVAALIAAAFVIGLLPAIALWPRLAREAQISSDRQAATVALVNSHFAHAPFVPVPGHVVKAKVMYSRTADWMFIVAQTTRPYAVAAQEAGKPVILGTLHVSGSAGELFVPHAAGVRVLMLLDGSTTAGRVTLPYRR